MWVWLLACLIGQQQIAFVTLAHNVSSSKNEDCQQKGENGECNGRLHCSAGDGGDPRHTNTYTYYAKKEEEEPYLLCTYFMSCTRIKLNLRVT